VEVCELNEQVRLRRDWIHKEKLEKGVYCQQESQIENQSEPVIDLSTNLSQRLDLAITLNGISQRQRQTKLLARAVCQVCGQTFAAATNCCSTLKLARHCGSSKSLKH